MKKTFTNRFLNNKILRLNYLFVLIGLFVFSSISCKKKTLAPLSPTIEIGDPKGMEIIQLDTPLYAGIFAPVDYPIDLDGDGQNDIVYNASYWGSIGGGYHGHQQISIINNKVSFRGSPFTDTAFVDFRKYSSSWPGTILTSIYKTYYFNRLGPDDSIENVVYYPFKTKNLEHNEVLSITDNYKSQTIILLDSNYDHIVNSVVTKDTTFQYHANGMVNIYPYPLNIEIYFGFKVTDDKLTRMGWIRFMITGSSGARIFETAIQKN